MGQIWQKDSWDINRLVNWKGSILYGKMMRLVCDVWVLGDIQYSQLNMHDTCIWQDTYKDVGVLAMKWLIGEICCLTERMLCEANTSNQNPFQVIIVVITILKQIWRKKKKIEVIYICKYKDMGNKEKFNVLKQ